MSSYHLSVEPMKLNEFVIRAAAHGWTFGTDGDGNYITDGKPGWVRVYEEKCTDGRPHIKLWRGGNADIASLQLVCQFVEELTGAYGRLDYCAEERREMMNDGEDDPWED